MNEKYFPKRGDVYYVRFDKSYGSEMAVGRPVIVMSRAQEDGSTPLVNCMYMTTTKKEIGVGVPLTSTIKKSWALPSQLVTIDIGRFREHMCVLTAEEMAEIEAALAATLGLELKDSYKESAALI